jgi:DNA-directed RNA polymerase specialized sigma24 family protein
MPRGGRTKALQDRIAAAVATDLPTRLHKAAQEARDAEEAWKLALERRDRIVVEALDVHQMSQTAVADIIGVRKGRIHGILLASQADPGEEE